MSGEPPPQVYRIEGKIAVTADVLKQQATDIMKKIDNFSTNIKNQREKRNAILQKIYGVIASMNLTNADKDVKPTNEAELVDAIEFLKTNDSIEKEKLKDLNALYTTIKDSELPGANEVENLTGLSKFITATKKTIAESNGEKDNIYAEISKSSLDGADKVSDVPSLSNFLGATSDNIFKGKEELSDANKTIDGCQTHFNDIANRLSGMGAAIDPANISDLLGKDMEEDNTTQTTSDEKIERERERLDESYQGIITKLQIMVKKVVDVHELGFKFYSSKLTPASRIDKKLDAAVYVTRASELIKFQIILKYVIMIMKNNSYAQRAIKDVLKPIETGLKVNIGMNKYEDVVKNLLGITVKDDSVDNKSGKLSTIKEQEIEELQVPTTPPELSFEEKCLVIMLTKNILQQSAVRYTEGQIKKGDGDEVPVYINNTINQYEEDVTKNLVDFLTSENVVDLLSASNVEIVSPQEGRDKTFVKDFIPDAKGANAFMSDIISSKKTGGKTMKKRHNLNKGGKTIRKMLKRTLKRGGNFRKKLTKRK